MADKIRLDVYMIQNGLANSRARAKDLITKGQVFINDNCQDKPSTMIDPEKDKPEIRGEVLKYVSRGGLKLEKAIDVFLIDLFEKTAMDIGASTGGFTDCMLKNGAKKVFSVDVGTDQLSPILKCDKRVINMENTNIRYLTLEKTGESVDFISIDVSFISLKLVLPVAYELLRDNGEVVALIKPQFEAGREFVGKKGVVKDIKVHERVCADIIKFAKSLHFYPLALSYSPIKGPEGNIEYLLYMTKKETKNQISSQDIKQIVKLSHNNL